MRRALLILTLLLALPAAAEARGRAQPAHVLYEQNAGSIATVEYVQEFVAGGQKHQQRAFTDGVVVSDDGLVLISGRVRFPQRAGGAPMGGGSRPTVSGFKLRFHDGRELAAEAVTFDDDLNLGLLRVKDEATWPLLRPVRFAEGYEPRVGDGLTSLTLYGADYGRTPVLQPLLVNALLATPQDLWSLGGVSGSLLGAPLFDARGRVVGVVAQVPMSPWAARQVLPALSGPVGLSYDRFADFLSTADEAPAVADEAPAAGKDDDSGWLGIEYQPLGRDLAAHLGLSEGGGIVLTRVIEGSPAEAGGLRALDVLVELDGQRIDVEQDSDTSRFSARIRSHRTGESVRFVREASGGARDEVTVVLSGTPLGELHAERREDERFEITVRELTLDTRLGQRLPPGEQGVVVDAVTGAGWAGLAGLRKGHVIQRINRHEITDLDSFTAALAELATEQPGQVLFFVRFRRETRFYVAEPQWDEP